MITILDRLFGVLVGIEFRKETIVVSLLKNGMSGISLLSSASFPFKDDEVTISDIKEHISTNAPKAKRAFVSIPDKWALIKFTEVPSTKGKGRDALPNLMKYEIERHIPFDPETVLYDFQIVEDTAATYKVAFIAVQKKRVERIREFLGKLLLEPHSITISSLSLLNTVELSGAGVGGWKSIAGIVPGRSVLGGRGETSVSLFLDEPAVSVSVIRDGYCVRTRSFPYHKEEPAASLSDDICAYLDDIKGELDITGYKNVVFSGDAAMARDISGSISAGTGADLVTAGDLPKFTDMPEEVNETLHSSIGACFGELGIGKYRINVLPHKPDYELNRVTSLGTKVLAVIVVLLIVGIVSVQSIKQKDALGRIDAELKKNEPKVVQFRELSSEFDAYKRNADFLQAIKGSEVTLDVLAELSKILPDDTWISNFQYKSARVGDGKASSGEIVIGGYSDASSKLISILEGSPYFERVNFVGSIKKMRDKEGFKIQSSVVKQAGRDGR